MSSWKTPLWHGECLGCEAAFEGHTVKDVSSAMRAHERVQSHETAWVVTCGCGERFGPGSRAEAARALRRHLAQRDYEPLSLLGMDA